MDDLKQEYSNLNIEEPLRLLENTDSEVFLQIQKIAEEFSKFSSNSSEKRRTSPQPLTTATQPTTPPKTESTSHTPNESEMQEKQNQGIVDSERFLTIIETFNNVGEILKVGETVITEPRNVCQFLVKNLINHEILNKEENTIESLDELTRVLYDEDSTDPKDRDKLLKKGFYFKSFAIEDEEDEGEKMWKMLEATGLGIELSPIKMFVPLLISEGCKTEMQVVAGNFHREMKSKKFNMTARFDVENLSGNGVDLFHKLCFKVVQMCKLELCYSRNIENRTKDCWVSSCYGHLSRSRLSPFLASQYQKCDGHKCSNTFIIQASSDNPEDISEAGKMFKSCIEEVVSDLAGKAERFIGFGNNDSVILKRILDTRPEDFVTETTLPMSIEDYEREIQEFIEKCGNSFAETNENKKEGNIPEIDDDASTKHNQGVIPAPRLQSAVMNTSGNNTQPIMNFGTITINKQ